jgi:hypothetical protein
VDPFAKAYLSYSRACLADSRCRSPDVERDVVEIAPSELNEGRLGATSLRALFDLTRQQRFDEENEEKLWPVPLTVCPYVYALGHDHARQNSLLPTKIVPVVLFASVSKDGRIWLDPNNSRPVIPRALLRPTQSDVAIGELDVADAACSKLAPCTSWQDALASALALLKDVTGQSTDELRIESYERHTHALCKAEGRGPLASARILELIDLALTRATPPLPLYEALLRERRGEPDHAIKAGLDLIRLSVRHLGQMESRYGLSPSQRETLLTVLANEGGEEVVAIDGPPGTGKTTLLLSVIATNWVACALADAPAPITVATSTNNQSVLNVLEAFARTGTTANAVSQRWLPGIESYGISMPARTKEDLGSTKAFTVHTLIEKGKTAVHPALEFEGPERFALAKAAFLENLAAACACPTKITLGEAVALLRSRIRSAVENTSSAVNGLLVLAESAPSGDVSTEAVAHRLAEAEREHHESALRAQASDTDVQKALELRRRWKHHVSAEPWRTSVLATFWLTGRRRARDEAFCADAEVEFGASIPRDLRHVVARGAIDSAITSHLAALENDREVLGQQAARAHVQLARLKAAYDAVRACLPEPAAITVESVQHALDVGPRHDAFRWATHYWEAKYLVELEQSGGRVIDTVGRDGLERQYRRLAKLWPCFVSTLYVLPHRFTGWNQVDLPLYNVIDLLIVDEAGQVPPEVGAVSFTLAKRALVVGDVDQLAPIHGVEKVVDGPNALRHQLVRDEHEQDAFLSSGMAASRGSLMTLAQRATAFAKYPERGRGLFLREHRRCLPQIIQICNEMKYDGRLLPCRLHGPEKPFPTVGYVHIPGRSQQVGSSRINETEAHAIAQWVADKRSDIEQAFAADGKPFGQLVSVVTPFNAQARLIRTTLNKVLGRQHGISVGTVHTLQGAECRVVIFSPTYGLETQAGDTFFDKDRSMLNVTVSRAQDSFLVFGNMGLFQPGSRRLSSFVARALFADPENELDGVKPELLCPALDLSDGQLIADLPQHQAALAEALRTAKSQVVIVSPFLASSALEIDGLEQKIKGARLGNRVTVRVITDEQLNYGRRRTDFDKCVASLRDWGADVRFATSQGVHSKLLLVDRSWLVVGSFNWLSAVRRSGSPYQRYESSLRYQGELAFDMIERSLTDLKALTA